MGCHWDQQWECDAVLSTEGTQKKKKIPGTTCDLSQKVTMNCFKICLFLVLIQFRLFSPSLRVTLENFIATSNA